MKHQHFRGIIEQCQHDSTVCQASMGYAVFEPHQPTTHALIILPDLHDRPTDFLIYSGLLNNANCRLFCPDTSPRVRLEDDTEEPDFGFGASFYLDAVQQPWAEHYQMQSYLDEWLTLLQTQYALDHIGLMGYGMGGHAALAWAARRPATFTSLSAMNPICSLMQSALGQVALNGFLGVAKKRWVEVDAMQLLADSEWQQPIHIDQAETDARLLTDRCPELLHQVCATRGIPLNLKIRLGFDHSAFFVQSFIQAQLQHHQALAPSS